MCRWRQQSALGGADARLSPAGVVPVRGERRGGRRRCAGAGGGAGLPWRGRMSRGAAARACVPAGVRSRRSRPWPAFSRGRVRGLGFGGAVAVCTFGSPCCRSAPASCTGAAGCVGRNQTSITSRSRSICASGAARTCASGCTASRDTSTTRATGYPCGNTPPRPGSDQQVPAPSRPHCPADKERELTVVPVPTAIVRTPVRSICTGTACSGSVIRMTSALQGPTCVVCPSSPSRPARPAP